MIKIAPQDKRIYKHILLTNNLSSLIISDPELTESACSLAVHVGSINEPLSGLAHFIEHMLFMGSNKYPDEKVYHHLEV